MKKLKMLQIKKKLKNDHCLTIKDQMAVKGGGVVLVPILGIQGLGNYSPFGDN